MFLSAENYKQELLALLRTEKRIDIAVAFWGKDSNQLFKETASTPRIVCNLMTGASNPKVIKLLADKFPKSVRHLSELHAKFIISDDLMIVGSANFSNNGLTQNPDGNSGLEEAGVSVDRKDQVEDASRWFENIWSKASPVAPRDIEIAQIAWDRNRANRPVSSSARNLLELPNLEFEDRPIYVALWQDCPCEEAVERFDEVRQTIIERLAPSRITDVDYFQDAKKYPKDSVLISAQILSNSRINVSGAWCRVPEFDQKFSGNRSGTLQIVVKRKRILDRLFDAATQRELSKIIAAYIKSMKDSSDPEYESGVVPLFRVLQCRTDG